MWTPLQPPAILSLCTGGGMLDDGLERAIGPVRTVAYVEIEAFCVWNLVAKMEAGLLAPTPVFTNLKTFPASAFHRKIHGIIGGYPCQPISHAGQRKGEADERHLFPHICTIIDAVRPLWCFFENVPGHPQHPWEAPRVEPGLGFSAHGYNFREDLLRMAGNGVVPQTAAKAFLELSKRF